MVATAAALAPARVASARRDAKRQCTQLNYSTDRLVFKNHSEVYVPEQSAAVLPVSVGTSRAALGEGELLVKGRTAHSRHR